MTTEIIKNTCQGDGVEYVGRYLNLLAENLHRLITITAEFCNHFNALKNDQDALLKYLKRYIPIADIDNAHAMYLSSDNWEFSVFNNVLSQIALKYPDLRSRNEILKGGIIDIRTYIHLVASEYPEVSLADHVKNSINKELVKEHLFSPILLYPFIKNSRKNGPKALRNTEVNTCPLIQAYNDLYHARYLYDSLEYFGYYGFVRNAIAELCNYHYEATGKVEFQKFAEFITLYQFNFCLKYFNS